MLLSTIGLRLRQRRVSLGLTQAALAAAANVSPRFPVQLGKGEGNISVLFERCEYAERLAHDLWADGVALENCNFVSIGHVQSPLVGNRRGAIITQPSQHPSMT